MTDALVAGVGGQGVLSAAALLAEAARRDGFEVHQAEVHGMSQRGGTVRATLRISSDPIHGDLVPTGGADLVIGLEPLEALRCLPALRPGGMLVSSLDPVADLPGYPEPERMRAALAQVPGAVLLPAAGLARAAGSGRALNLVVVGAASPFLPVRMAVLESCIAARFAAAGERVVEANLRALRAGREAAVPV